MSTVMLGNKSDLMCTNEKLLMCNRHYVYKPIDIKHGTWPFVCINAKNGVFMRCLINLFWKNPYLFLAWRLLLLFKVFKILLFYDVYIYITLSIVGKFMISYLLDKMFLFQLLCAVLVICRCPDLQFIFYYKINKWCLSGCLRSMKDGWPAGRNSI